MARMATLILISGIPGSGKSTWAKQYQREHPNTYIVASDEIRVRLFGGSQRFTDEALVWKTFLEDLNAHVNEDCTVIADATNLQNRYRRNYCVQTPGYDRHVLVVFEIPFDICVRQNKMRAQERIISDRAMVSLQEEFEEPTQEIIDLYDEYILIKEDYVERRIKPAD